jgi:hypothetical protein
MLAQIPLFRGFRLKAGMTMVPRAELQRNALFYIAAEAA